MSRVSIALPEIFQFTTELPVLIGQVNSGNHLGNDALVSVMNEARVRFTRQQGFLENDVARGLTMVNADLAVVYQSEAHYGEVLVVSIAAVNFHRCGYDFVYRLTDKASGRAIAQGKTAHILIDAEARKPISEPPGYFDPLRSN
ncbi:acyl-CoA thioesterase [Litorivivens sp.]|uniref:acyl-CoA thioesterase n=1 Tax=Litorivivens sp. TaxID=2020868 RepID=UPI00356695E9